MDEDVACPSIFTLLTYYDNVYFSGKLGAVSVEWSKYHCRSLAPCSIVTAPLSVHRQLSASSAGA